MNEIFDSREFYKPIVTVYDVELALNDVTDVQFSYDFNACILNPVNTQSPSYLDGDVSLINGKIRGGNGLIEDGGTSENQLMKPSNTVALKSAGAQFLRDRTWQGLEQQLGQTEVKLAEEGRRGIAQGYVNECSS